MRLISASTVGSLAFILGLLAAPVQAESSPPATPPPPTAPTPPAASTPTVHQVRVFGKTVKGRILRAYRVGDPTSTRKAVLLSTMHGDEPATAKILLNLMQGPAVTGADIWIIPNLNRDGLARDRRTNARGVDLNRNFPTRWKKQTGRYNSGPRAASEPETKALMRFLDQVDPDYVISLHQPLHGVDTSYGKARAMALRLVRGTGLPKKVFNCRSGCHGTMTQWFNKNHRGAALTVEYGATVSTRQQKVTGPQGLLAGVFADR